MEKRRIIFLTLFCAFPFCGNAQNDFDAFRRKADTSFDKFKKKANQEYEDFRRKMNEEYAALMEKAWKEFNAFGQTPVPEDEVKPVPPVVYPREEENKPAPVPKPIPYDTVVPAPVPTPQPQPVVPIEEKPSPVIREIPKVQFTFFGTAMSVRFDTSQKVVPSSAEERDIARAWKAMSTDNYSNLVYDCLQLREKNHLCDWAYLELIRSVAEKIHGKGTNASTMLIGYVYCQSGYKMRFARDDSGRLYMMYASRHTVFRKNYFTVDGEMYYPYGASPQRAWICDVAYPQEKPMSLVIASAQKFADSASPSRRRQARRYPDVATTMTSNLNLMNFYETYPTSQIGENMVSRWAMYANTPMSESVSRQIYPSLRSAIQGCDQLTAVNKLLNYVQTAFVYEYDDKVWGHDRAFFAEETLYYPYSDCEDRSILFTRLVRDLLGLDCILIYYPGHLASAVAFTEGNVSGDWIQLGGRKFVIADATYENAPVGLTMPGMDNQTAKVILLKR